MFRMIPSARFSPPSLIAFLTFALTPHRKTGDLSDYSLSAVPQNAMQRWLTLEYFPAFRSAKQALSLMAACDSRGSGATFFFLALGIVSGDT